VWTGSEVVFWSYGSVTSYNPGTDEWRYNPLTPSVPGLEESVVWTGQELLAWGGSSIQGAGAPLGIATGVAYRPDGDATSCPLRAGQIAPASDSGNPLPSRPALAQQAGPDWQTIENEAAAVSMQIPPDWRSLSLVV